MLHSQKNPSCTCALICFSTLSFKSLANSHVRSVTTDSSLIPTQQKRARHGQSEYVLRATRGVWLKLMSLCIKLLFFRHTCAHTHTIIHTHGSFVRVQCSFSRVLFFWRCSQVTGALKAPAVLPHCGCMTNFSTTSLGKSLFSLVGHFCGSRLWKRLRPIKTEVTVLLKSPALISFDSFSAVKPLARLRKRQAVLKKMWCVDHPLVCDRPCLVHQCRNELYMIFMCSFLPLFFRAFDIVGRCGSTVCPNRHICGDSLLLQR